MANASVIRQFLVSLGWEVDQAGMNRFATSIAVQSEAVRELGEGMKAAALKVADFVRGIVEDLDKLYFTSKQTGASVANLEAWAHALGMVGQSGEQGFKSLQHLYNLLKVDPTNTALWLKQNLDVKAFDEQTGKLRDTFTVHQEMLAAIQKKQYQGAYLDSKVVGGIDKTFLDAATSPEALKAFDDYQARQKQMGVDAQQAAGNAHEFANALRDLRSEITILKESLLLALKAQWDKLSPATQQQITDYIDLGKQIRRLVYWWEHLSDTTKTVIVWTLKAAGALALLFIGLTAVGSMVKIVTFAFEAFVPLVEGAAFAIGALTSPIGLAIFAVAALGAAFHFGAFDGMMKQLHELTDFIGEQLRPALVNLKSDWDDLVGRIFEGKATGKPGVPFRWNGMDEAKAKLQGLFSGQALNGTKSSASDTAAPGNTAALFSALEKKYNLPAGLIDSDYAAESSRGKNMYSAKGAMGPFQFMPATAKEFGLDNPYDLGASADAFARKMSHLLKYYKGDLTKAVAAYNWGEGNIDRKGLAGAPQETRDYVPKVLGGLDGGNPYAAEMPAARGTSGAGAAAGTPAITQHITTTVTGAADPQAVGKAVGGAIDKGNVLLVGALQGRTS